MRRWFRFFFNLVPLRTKVMGIALLLVFLLGGFLIWQVQGIYVTSLRSELQNRGLSLARYLAARSEDLILTDKLFALHELAADAVVKNEDVRYVLFLDAEGRLLVDTFNDGLPEGLLQLNTLAADQAFSLRSFRSEEGVIHDLAVPVLEGKGGVLRLGLAETRLSRAVAALKYRLWAITILVSLLGVGVAYALASTLTAPLRELVTAAEKVGSGRWDWRVSLDWARDEFGQLAAAFNTMLDKVQQAYEESQRLWQELRDKEQMRTHLLQKVITAHEEERKRVARELHDHTAQALTTLILGLSALEGELDSPPVAARLRGLRATVNEALDEIRALSLSLRPSVLDDLGLGAAVQRYVQDCSRLWGMEIGLHIGGLDGQRLSPDVEIIVYRVIQEALSNVARHAKAENVSVVLERRGDELVAVVEDDGVGFSLPEVMQASHEKNLGLLGMQERAELVGGSLTIETAPGEGTTVYLRVPLSGAAKEAV